jgi:hypothetical protein
MVDRLPSVAPVVIVAAKKDESVLHVLCGGFAAMELTCNPNKAGL